VEWPTCHGQPSDDDRTFCVFPPHAHTRPSAMIVFTNEASMIGKVGEDLEKDFERELENCTTQVSVDQSRGSGVLTSTQEGVCASSRSHDLRRAGNGATTHTGTVRAALSVPIGLRGVSLVHGVPVIMVGDWLEWSRFSVGFPPGFGSSNRSARGDAAAVEVFGALMSLYDGETLNSRTGACRLTFLLCGLERHLDGTGQHMFPLRWIQQGTPLNKYGCSGVNLGLEKT